MQFKSKIKKKRDIKFAAKNFKSIIFTNEKMNK